MAEPLDSATNIQVEWKVSAPSATFWRRFDVKKQNGQR